MDEYRDNVPIHVIVTNQLINKIEQMNVEDKLPSERDLCEEFNASRTTIRHALDTLKVSGYIKKIHGKGNFVSKPNKNKENLFDYYSFTEQTLARGMVPSVKILGFSKEVPNEAVRQGMKLLQDEKVIKLDRLRLADNVPMLLETTYIPTRIFRTLTKDILKEYPLYDIFRNIFQIHITEFVEQFSSVNISNPQAKLLLLDENTACLRIKRFTYDNHNNVVELTYSFAHPDQFIYRRNYKV